MTIRRDNGRPPYHATVLPIRPGHMIEGLSTRPKALLFVGNPDHDAMPTRVQHGSDVFGLTPAEARLAIQLVAGASLTETADLFRSDAQHSARAVAVNL